MSLIRNLFGKKQGDASETKAGKYKARCTVHILEPQEQDSMFPMDINVEVLTEGLHVSFNDNDSDGFTRGALIGMYHWLNSENNTKPLLMHYTSMEKVFCDFYEDHCWVEATEKRLKTIPPKRELHIRIIYENKTRGTKLKVQLHHICDAHGNTANKATQILYNTILRNMG